MFYLGIDMGGTNVKAGVVDRHAELQVKTSLPTGRKPADLAPGPVISQMVLAAERAMAMAGVSRRQIAAVGVLSPGQASLERGVVHRSANLPLWKDVPLRARISAALKIPAVLENDANAAAYGEWWAGAGKSRKTPLKNLFMFTLGTGVGGGIVYEGRVIRGAFDFAAEVGHMIMVPGGELCGCGQRGCLERYCSAKHMAGLAERELREGAESSLSAVLRDKGSITSEDVAVAAKAGDAFAAARWQEMARYLALACINVCHLMDPEMIVIAGGMSQAGRFLLDPVRKHFRGEWWKMTPPTAKIALAQLGNDAGMIGAAGVAKEAHARKALPRIGR